MHCEHEHDDGAYVLGALSPAERVAYERHLATCSFCREAVADISRMPDLLARLDAREFANLLDPSLTAGDPIMSGHPGASLRDFATSARGPAPAPLVKRRKKSFGVRVVSSAAATVLVMLIGLGVFAWARGNGTPATPPPGPAAAMTPVDGSSPVSATVRLTGTTGGTRVDLVCAYSSSATRPYTFRLIAYGPDEELEQIGSWQASPGAEFPMKAVTHFARGSLSRLELVKYDGTALLAYDVP
ncbi:MAG TPA: zf-HC2 domain-containing protein [Actinoplanes sp.]